LPTIEKNLERIADALEALSMFAKTAYLAPAVAAVQPASAPQEELLPVTTTRPEPPKAEKPEQPKADKPKQAEPEKPKQAEPEKPKQAEGPHITKDELRKALQSFREIEGTPAMLDVLKRHGASNINELPIESYASVLKAVQ